MRLRIATALSEIVVGTIAQLLIGASSGCARLTGAATWIKLMDGTGGIRPRTAYRRTGRRKPQHGISRCRRAIAGALLRMRRVLGACSRRQVRLTIVSQADRHAQFRNSRGGDVFAVLLIRTMTRWMQDDSLC